MNTTTIPEFYTLIAQLHHSNRQAKSETNNNQNPRHTTEITMSACPPTFEGITLKHQNYSMISTDVQEQEEYNHKSHHQSKEAAMQKNKQAEKEQEQ